MRGYVGAIDQGTTSTRFMVFDKGGREVARHQVEHDQILPRPGWVEHDALQIVARTNESIIGALGAGKLTAVDLAAIGVTNQRETTVVWNPKTGRPWYNAIVWQDTRTDRIINGLDSKSAALIRSRTGLPPATYFSGAKIQWILDNVAGVRAAADTRRSGVRQYRHLGDLEPHRRARRRLARHRCHQRQPDDADGSADAGRGTTTCSRSSASPRHAPGHPLVVRPRRLRRDAPQRPGRR